MHSTQVHFLAVNVPQFSSWCRDGNTGTATYRNAAVVDYERNLRQENVVRTRSQCDSDSKH